MRLVLPRLARVAALASLLLACRATPFRCDATHACEARAVCSSEGYCAEPSSACVSGYAYTTSAASPGACAPSRDAATDVTDVAVTDVTITDVADVAVADVTPPDAAPSDVEVRDVTPSDTPVDGADCPLVLRALAPLSGTRLRARDVELTLRRLSNQGSVELQVSREPTFAALEPVTVMAPSGDEVTATARLTRGQWFWRARSVCGSVSSGWSPTWSLWSHGESSRTQSPLGWLPDLDLDGHGDLAIGFPRSTRVTSRPSATVEVIFGHTGATSPTRTAAQIIEGRHDGFGAEVAIVPDMNGDGTSELAIGGCVRAPSTVCVNTVWLYAFPSVGSGDRRMFRLLGTFSPPTVSNRFGVSIAGVGDLDRDGYGDVVIGAPDDRPDAVGTAWIVWGGAEPTLAPTAIASPAIDRGTRFGWSVAGVGDASGDGVADVLITSLDRAWLFVGGSRTTGSFAPLGLPALSDTTWGTRASLAGDLDADGVADVALARPGGASGNGEVLFFPGGADAIARWSMPTSRVVGSVVGAHLGLGLEGGCELTGDARDDLVASAPDGAGYLSIIPGASNVDTLRTLSLEGVTAQPGRALAVLGDYDRAGGDDFAISEGATTSRVLLFRTNNVGAVVPWAALGPVSDADYGFALGGR